MIPAFVKKFDFRGVYNEDIKDSDAYYLGLALEKTIQLKKVLVGWDTRLSSKNLALNFMSALKHKNIEISYMDKCPIDYITAASNVFDFDLSVMFTGSHNPWNWTGLLMHTRGGDSINGTLVEKIVENYYSVLDKPFKFEFQNLSKFRNLYEETEKLFSEKIRSLIPLSSIKKMEVLVDLGDGSGSRSLELLEKLLPQIKFNRINDKTKYDEQSSHVADPSNIDNMKDLMDKMKTGKYTCGAAFDSDGDRVLATDENGEYLNGSLLGSAHIACFIDQNLSTNNVGYAVDCGPSSHNTVVKMNKETNRNLSVKAIPVGRSIVRQLIREGKLDFGIENVGHFYSKDFFMTDSGVFSLAIILYWISINGPLSTLKTNFPDGMRTQIFSTATSGNKSDNIILKINERFVDKKTKKIDVDGVRCEFLDGKNISTWYAIRKSGYEEITKYYFGSLNETEFRHLSKIFQSLVTDSKSKASNS